MRGLGSVLGVVGIVVLLLAVVAASYGAWTVRRSFPQTSGVITSPASRGPVEVLRDEQGIPQLYADTAADLFFAQGYVHAQDRFFEMDFRRHVTAGRLSEMFGCETLETDQFIRTHGLAPRRRAGAARCWSRRTRDAAEVVRRRGQRLPRRPQLRRSCRWSTRVLGLSGLDYRPSRGRRVDSLAWLKAMAWDLRGNMDDEIDRVPLSLDHTERRRSPQLYPPTPTTSTRRSSSRARCVDGVFEQNATGAPVTPQPPPAGVRPGVVAARSSRVRDRLDAMPELHRQGRRHRSELLGRRRRAHRRPASRCSPTTRTSASSHAGHLVCRWACTAARGRADCPFDVAGLHVLRACRAW